MYILLGRRNPRKLTCFTAKFEEEAIEHFEKSLGEFMVYDEHFNFGAVKKCW